MDLTWVISPLYTLGILIVKGIVWLINQVYGLIILLADIDLYQIFSDDIKNKFFALIGLFMVFKLAFSVIQYIINPDKMTDSSVGAQKVLTRVVISLALLGTINNIFNEAKQIQRIVLNNGVLEKLIFGGDSSNISSDIDTNSGMSEDVNARFLSYAIFAPFITFNEEAFADNGDMPSCAPGLFMDSIGDVKAGSYKCESDCCKRMESEIDDNTRIEKLKKAIENHDIGTAAYQVINLKMNKKMIFNFDFFISVIIGIVTCVILVVIAINVAIRAVKFALLQLIAPLPIISYIDVSDKKGMFGKWLKLVISTYIDLFIRLFSFYFSIMIVTEVFKKVSGGIPTFSGASYTFSEHPLVIIFLIIGTLLFATQLPKILQDLFDFKGDGPTKGFIGKGLSAIGAGILGLGAGAVGGAVAANSRIRQKFSEIDADSSLTDAQKKSAKRQAQRSIIGRSLTTFEPLTTAANSFVGGIKGKGNFSSTFSSVSAGIKRAGAARNAKYETYTDSSGKTRSAYNGVLSNMRNQMATNLGIQDKGSAVSQISSTLKTEQTKLKQYEEEYQNSTTKRLNFEQQFESNRNDLVASGKERDLFETTFGRDAIKDGKAVVYKVERDSDGKAILKESAKKDLQTFSATDYMNNLVALEQYAHDKVIESGKTEAEATKAASDYIQKYEISNDEFTKIKSSSISYRASIEQEEHTRNNLTSQRKVVARTQKTLDTVNKAIKGK